MYQLNKHHFPSQGNANMNASNLRGDTPLNMLQSQIGSVWVGSKVAEKIREQLNTSRSRTFLFKITKDKVSEIINKRKYWKCP